MQEVEEDIIIKAKTPQLFTDLLHEINPLPCASKIKFKHPNYQKLPYKQLVLNYSPEREEFLAAGEQISPRFTATNEVLDDILANGVSEILFDMQSAEAFFVFRIGFLDPLLSKYRTNAGTLHFTRPIPSVSYLLFHDGTAEVSWLPQGMARKEPYNPILDEIEASLWSFQEKEYVFSFEHTYKMRWKNGV